MVALGSMDAFRDVADAVSRGDAGWRSWYDTEAPERAPVPAYEQQLSKFERMCIVKACPLLKCCIHPQAAQQSAACFRVPGQFYCLDPQVGHAEGQHGLEGKSSAMLMRALPAIPLLEPMSVVVHRHGGRTAR